MQLNHKVSAMTLALAALTMAAEAPKISGYVTTTWNHDFNSPASRTYSDISFAHGTGSTGMAVNAQGGKESSFQLNAAHFTLTGNDAERASYVVDIDAGTNATTEGGAIVANGYGIAFEQAYINLPFNKTFGMQAGKFYTSEGIESGNSALDATITRGLLFGQSEPTAHTGAVLTIKANNQFNIALGGVNNWDSWTKGGIPMFYGKIGMDMGNTWNGAFSAYAGSYNESGDNLLSFDLSGTTKVINGVDLGLQFNYMNKEKGITGYNTTSILDYNVHTDAVTDQTNIGFGIQPNIHVGQRGQIGLRYEFLNVDPDAGKSTTVQTIGIAPGYRMSPATLLRAEYRLDIASEKIFENDNGARNEKVDNSVAVELSYQF